ncbi:Protein kinase domain family protein [Babesia bovis T2Bo]|uniref:Protein kinase domain containing protein n=1 Tax=Babesia bovis TaxID=5865 RepID=A7AMV1_BABBO|nr:Protein kinase domain family protein [Babesia bovis T2Bo]EDO07885.1 Protein kinase domain family protein [Babesia bovis T2Bo]|eukprot:XP_001611453.1 protein kinase domain containing protein [Babesia bovis T2Bo]
MVTPGWRQGWSEELRIATNSTLSTLSESDYESFVDVLAFWEVFRLMLKADALMSSCVKAFAGTRACGTKADHEFDALLERGIAKGKVLFKDVYLVSQLLNHYVNPHQRLMSRTTASTDYVEPITLDTQQSRDLNNGPTLGSQYTDQLKKQESSSNVARSTEDIRSEFWGSTADSGSIAIDKASSVNYDLKSCSNSFDNWNMFAKFLSTSNTASKQFMLPLYSKIPFISLGNFVVFYRINEGSFGKVHVGFHKLHRRTYALKVISKTQFNSDTSLFRRLKDEMSLVTAVVHPNVVRTFEIIETVSTLVIAMEYCDGGDMIGLIKDYSPMSESMARTIFRMVANGVNYLHSSNICHRDIKPENIFLKRIVRKSSGLISNTSATATSQINDQPINLPNGTMAYILKIGDFGAATRIPEDRLLLDTVGTMSYAAPEVLGCGGVMGYCGKSADIWSLGILLYAMLFGELPWHNEDINLQDAVQQILNNPIKIPLDISASLTHLLRHMLQVNPSKRPSVKEVLAHPWLSEVAEDHLIVKKIKPTFSKPS